MSVRQFTDEELAILRGNPNTLKASAAHISFTSEFKEHFWIELNGGVHPREILKDCGYDPEMLGVFRIKGLLQHLRDAKRKERMMHTKQVRQSSGNACTEPEQFSTEDELRQQNLGETEKSNNCKPSP